MKAVFSDSTRRPLSLRMLRGQRCVAVGGGRWWGAEDGVDWENRPCRAYRIYVANGRGLPGERKRGGRAGFVLLEMIIALTVFAVAVSGLTAALHASLDAANLLRRQATVRRGLESILAEAKSKPKREEMVLSFRDEGAGVEYRTELEELKRVNRRGLPLKGLYTLRAIASDLRAAAPLHDKAEVYVYRP